MKGEGKNNMKNFKRFISILMVFVMTFAMAACSQQPASTDQKPAEEKPAAEAPAAEPSSDIGDYSWSLGTDSPEDTVTHKYAVKFAEEVGALSGGKMKIQVYSSGTLGGDREMLESIKSGNIQFVVQTTAPQVNFMPKLAVFDLPNAYATIEEVRKAVDNEEFLKTINGVYEEAGYHLMAYADQGFRVMSTNNKIESINDFKGQKIRTMENANHIAYWKALGANPTPMAFAEVYIGLQQGTIDAQENPYEVIVSAKFYEQQKYVIKTNHIPHLLSLITSSDVYNGLNDAEKAILDQAAANAKGYAREQADSRVADRVSIIESNGAEIVEINEETFKAMQEAAKPVYESIKQQVGEELVNAYLGK